MDNTQAITLSDIADTHEFLENPLDVYETYTYNIEWFVVDRDADQKFQEFGENLNVATIVNDGWPGVTDTKITIAKTGVTTEFNLTDLTVQSLGAGIAETRKIAGVATHLEFTVTQLGRTNLVDNLQNAIALCGWKDIASTHFYIKINFVGVDKNGIKVKIPQTKVLTFTVEKLTELSTTTDTRGTTTLLRAPILQDTVVSHQMVSKTENAFSYKVVESLYDTLGVEEGQSQPKAGSFIDELNKSIKVKHPTLLPSLQNTYKITMSTPFKEWIKDASMKGVTSNTIKNMEPSQHNDAKQVGQVTPMMNIFNIINDICINTKIIKESLTRDTPGMTKIHKITPWLVAKRNGYNPITGTMAYDVEFFIDYEKKYLTQNMLDQANKTKNIYKTVQEMFDEHHVNKIYHYLFTGKNDQILDFSIILDNELAKVYSAPTDWYAYENIMKVGTIEGDELLKGYENVVHGDQALVKELTERSMKFAKKGAELAKKLDKEEHDLENEMIANIASQLGVPPGGIKEMLKGRSVSELGLWAQEQDLKLNIDQTDHIALQKIIKKHERDQGINAKQLNFQKMNLDRDYGDWIASGAAVSGERNWNNGVKQNAQKILSGVANANPKKMTLMEELDDDIVSKMTTEEFENILKAQANNPIVYQSLIKVLSKDPSTITIKPTDVEGVELARAKYYESKSNNVSMIHPQMVIKGDPHWLDGYMPPSLAKQEFGQLGSRFDLGQTLINGANGLILKSGIADGTDLHDNVIKRNLITSLFIVKTVTSNFSGGIFTQTLGMNKLAEAEAMSTVVAKVGPTIQEDAKSGAPSSDGSAVGEAGNNKLTAIDAITGNPHEISLFHKDGRLFVGTVVWKNGIPYDHHGRRLYMSGEIPIVPEKDKHINVSQYNDRLIETTDNIVISSAISTLGHHPMPFVDNAVRMNLATDWIDDMKDLSEACQRGITSSCTAVKEAQNKILETLGLTIEDQGKLSTLVSVNTQLNDVIANADPYFMFSEEEIAMYQIAAGGKLGITGFDSDAIEKIVVDTTGIKTPSSILANSSTTLGASRDNNLLNGNDTLVDAQTKDTLINTPTYTWTRKEHMSQVTHPNSNNDWKNTHWFEKKVEDVKNESCPPESKEININTRKLECVGIDENTLTTGEVNDVSILSEEINNILFSGSLRDQHGTGLIPEVLAKEYLWTDNANALIEKEIADNDLVITDDDKTELKTAVSTAIHQSVSLDELTDNDYREIQGYETEINKIVTDAYSDGHRGDVTRAVNVGLTEDKLAELNASNVNTTTKLDEYFWDIDGNRIWTEEKENIEAEMAELMLGQPDEKMTAVVTTVSGLNKTYIPIFNPTSTLNDQPAIIKNTEGQFDVVLAGKDNTYGGATTQDNLDQLSEAKNLFYHLTRTDTEMITFEDDMGIEFDVKDFSNISSYTLSDGTVISTPSSTFGIYTLDPNNMVPANKQDYKLLREKVADYFPNIEVISSVDGFTPTLSTLKDGTGHVILNGTAFYISP